MNILFYVYRKSTPPAAAISGSMQLMAGVKLCTGRSITNHSLYEHFILCTPPAAAISGSMQLVAGVKLCTGRPITNHPLYEHFILCL